MKKLTLFLIITFSLFSNYSFSQKDRSLSEYRDPVTGTWSINHKAKPDKNKKAVRGYWNHITKEWISNPDSVKNNQNSKDTMFLEKDFTVKLDPFLRSVDYYERKISLVKNETYIESKIVDSTNTWFLFILFFILVPIVIIGFDVRERSDYLQVDTPKYSNAIVFFTLASIVFLNDTVVKIIEYIFKNLPLIKRIKVSDIYVERFSFHAFVVLSLIVIFLWILGFITNICSKYFKDLLFDLGKVVIFVAIGSFLLCIGRGMVDTQSTIFWMLLIYLCTHFLSSSLYKVSSNYWFRRGISQGEKNVKKEIEEKERLKQNKEKEDKEKIEEKSLEEDLEKEEVKNKLNDSENPNYIHD